MIRSQGLSLRAIAIKVYFCVFFRMDELGTQHDLCVCQHISFLLLRVKGEITSWAWLLRIAANSFHPGLSTPEGN